MNFEEVNDYINNIPRFTSKNEPEKTRAFLEELGDFSRKIPTIHVAGTNGKGSVCAFLRAGLNANGLKVGMFTSPHLVNITERMMIDDVEISKSEFTNVFNIVMENVKRVRSEGKLRDYHPTFFEMLFFMAAVWFSEKKPDVILLETGLGGRLDATNSIECPVACVITEIGLDHCEYLGDTKELIAGEKAGIIKPDVPVICWNKSESVKAVFESAALKNGARAYSVGYENIKILESFGTGIDFCMQSLYDGFGKISLSTNASYQVENAALAFRTMEVLKDRLELDISKCTMGLENMKWPGRMEEVDKNFVLDGAHNEDGVKAFLETVAKDKNKGRFLLYSAVSDKDIEKVSSMIGDSDLFDKIFVCELSGYRAAKLDRLKEAYKDFDNVVFFETVRDALFAMRADAGKEHFMYAAGSLYLVAELKVLLAEERKDND